MIRRTFFLAVVSLAVSVTPSLAQQALVQYFYVVEVHAQPGMQGQFEDYIKKIQEAAGQVGGQGPVFAYQTMHGGQLNRYFFARPFNEWAEMDNWQSIPEMLNTAFGAEEGARILQDGTAAVITAETTIQSTQQAFSSASPGEPLSPMLHAVRTVIDPAKRDDYYIFLRHLREAEEAAGISATRREVIQGPAFNYVAIRPMENYAQRDGASGVVELLAQHVGENQARVLDRGGREAVVERELIIIQLRPDLSRMAQTN